ncbi:DUF3987 domain-containing protein [Bremerella cremea]|uniref:DUF3987 domain-containing protein n=1 Tax=Bremerella cremea TaxID=1031537 RepID=A0A368KN68_9BACT|nr:DUF3987 domain-containing protein [Bremerella cremea]RCS44634.1 DUF3987 domain-containing protein [Bremerella cremea]
MNSLPHPSVPPAGTSSDFPLPCFPTWHLPPAVRDYVIGEATASQTPDAVAATLVLGVCSAAIGGKVSIAARPGCSQPSNLFVAAINDGTNHEASLFTRIRRPLEVIEMGRVNAARSVQAEEKSRLRQAHLRLRELERDFARPQAFALAKEIADNPLLPVPRLILDDSSTAKLSTVLAQQQGHIARFSGVAAVRELLAGSAAQSNLARQELYRKAYRGESITLDQPGGQRVALQQTAITCVCAIPRSAVEGLHKRPQQSRGVTDCFLLAMPKSKLGQRKIAPPAVAEACNQQYATLVQDLIAIEGHATLRLSDAARHSFEAWEAEVETMLAPDAPLASFAAWGDNLTGNTLRIAAVLHCIRQQKEGELPDTDVSAETIEAAIGIAQFFLAHTVAALQTMQNAPPKPEPQTPPAASDNRSPVPTPADADQLLPNNESVDQQQSASPTKFVAPAKPLLTEGSQPDWAASPKPLSMNPGQHVCTSNTSEQPPPRPGRPPRKFRGKPVGSGKRKH